MPAELTAEALLDAFDHAKVLARDSHQPLTDLARAEVLQTGIVVARLARGEREVGYKIGFTNRSIWQRYGVFHPIWAPVWNTTLLHAVAAEPPRGSSPRPAVEPARPPVLRVEAVDVDCARFAQPRLEPEIVVRLHHAPLHDTPESVLEAAEWVAHGFEIVQSPFPDWRFSAAEAIAAQGLHGTLILGPQRPLSTLGTQADAILERLARCEVELLCNGRVVESGCGANALDGPMHAIAHLARELRRRGHSIEAGSIIATGTLTDAQPLRPDQRWTTRLTGIDLPGLDLRTH